MTQPWQGRLPPFQRLPQHSTPTLDSNTFPNSDVNTHTDLNSNTDPDTDVDSNTYTNPHADADSNADTNPHAGDA